MSLDLQAQDVRAVTAGLGPYALHVLEEAADTALWLHADEISTEHYLTTLLRDEEAGATRLVLHAFADPETLAVEILALAPGILVVGSGQSLPFSVRGVQVLEEARRAAEAAGGDVTPTGILAAAVERLEDELREALVEAGYDQVPIEAPRDGERSASSTTFFGPFSSASRQVLAAACRLAARQGRRAISPAHLVLAALEVEGDLAQRSGLGPHRARMVLVHRDADDTPLRERALRPDADLLGLLASAGAGADTSAVFGRCLRAGGENLRLLLHQQKITPALHERAGSAFGDPPVPV